MIHLAIKFCSVSDKEPTVVLPPGTKVREITFTDAVVIERGLASGQTAVAFGVMEGDEYFVYQTSVKILEALLIAVRGKEQYWNDERSSKNN